MDEAARKLKQMFANAPASARITRAGVTRIPNAAETRSAERMIQINVRVPAAFKRRVRLLAARDGIGLSTLIQRAVDAYEERYGSAPNV